MDSTRKEQLIRAGIDLDAALDRMMGNEALLERLLQKFLSDQNFDKLQTAVADHNLDDALTASHTLKGVCGNLSMTRLFELFSEQVSDFRAGAWEKAVGLLPEISAAYFQVARAIRS